MELKTNVNPEAVERVEKRPWSFRPVQINVTPDMVKEYFEKTPAAVSALLDEMMVEMPYTLEELLDRHREDFEDFVRGGC